MRIRRGTMRLDGKHLRRLVAAGTAAAALLVVGPAVANASTVSTQNGKLTYSAATGEQNATAVKENNGKFTFNDPARRSSPAPAASPARPCTRRRAPTPASPPSRPTWATRTTA
jgi:hypothetical protein